MGSVWAFRPATKQEQKLAYSSEENDKTFKCIGHLRADFGRDGDGFWSTWTDHNPELKTQEFKDALDSTINRLRFGGDSLVPLKNRAMMAHTCRGYSEARDDGATIESYTFRVDVLSGGEHSFIMRMSPVRGVYNLYCYCYRTEDLEGGLA